MSQLTASILAAIPPAPAGTGGAPRTGSPLTRGQRLASPPDAASPNPAQSVRIVTLTASRGRADLARLVTRHS
jgi:hypothetical protein